MILPAVMASGASRDWGSHSFSVQPHHPDSEDFLPNN